jgi:hypothetical protein
MSKHNISSATSLFVGDGYAPPVYGALGSKGVPIQLLTQCTWSTPAVADADLLIVAATSTELPNNATKTYTPATNGTSPTDNAAVPAAATLTTSTGATATVWTLDAPRNLAITTSTAAADTIVTFTGYDVYKVKIVEQITIATGASSGVGAKAFKYVESIAIYSASDITSDTVNIGTGSKLGLPYKLAKKSDLIRAYHTGAMDDSVTVVAAVTTTASATTGDVRGTVTMNSALDGNEIVAWMVVADPNSDAGIRGVTQYGG